MILNNVNHILFDLDGTLSDNSAGIFGGVKYALTSFGAPIPSDDILHRFVGPPLTESFINFCGFSERAAVEAVVKYRIYYRETGIFENALYDGVVEMLKALKSSGKKLYIATSKPEEFARKIAAKFGIDSYFEYIGGSTFDGTREKKADVIKYVLDECTVPTEEAIMIGDRHHDIDGGIACGLRTIGVLYGFGSRDELEKAGADVITETAMDIVGIIC